MSEVYFKPPSKYSRKQHFSCQSQNNESWQDEMWKTAPHLSLAVTFPGQGWNQAIKLHFQNNLTSDFKSFCCSFAG